MLTCCYLLYKEAKLHLPGDVQPERRNQMLFVLRKDVISLAKTNYNIALTWFPPKYRNRVPALVSTVEDFEANVIPHVKTFKLFDITSKKTVLMFGMSRF